MLPRTVFVLPLKLPPGKHDITVRFIQVPGLSLSWRDLVAPEEGEVSYYFHLQQRGTPPRYWPPDLSAPEGERRGRRGRPARNSDAGAGQDAPVDSNPAGK